MFEDWKRAWREAVENFRRELAESEADLAGDPSHLRAMRRELASARGALGRLDEEIARARKTAESERAEEAVCRRREGMARGIGDEETVRLAVEWAVRHAERAVVLERKVEVLEAERGLLRRDLDEMDRALQAAAPPAGAVGGGAAAGDGTSDPLTEAGRERERQDRDFARLDREARERAAEARLEELKKRMR